MFRTVTLETLSRESIRILDSSNLVKCSSQGNSNQDRCSSRASMSQPVPTTVVSDPEATVDSEVTAEALVADHPAEADPVAEREAEVSDKK